jgi:beta-N-acetylhexosaminidase
VRRWLWLGGSGIAVVVLVTVLFATSAAALPGRAASPAHALGSASSSLPASAGQGSVSLARDGNVAVVAADIRRIAASITARIAATPEVATAASMSTRQLAGQRVIYSYSGLTPPSRLLRLIRAGDVGGVIFFGGNYSSRSQFTAAVKKLETANAASSNPARSYPLLLMTDQEGGLVRRLPGAPVHSEKWIGSRSTASKRAAQARSAGQGAGKNLRSYGLNVNLAPVLDVYRKAGDFDDQYQRSYSRNAHTVSTLGASFIKSQQAAGVAATAKHFPGLGAATASQNTDLGPVTITLSRSALENTDEYPYKAAIAAGVDLVMVSWAKYPNLGSSRPAGLASTIVKYQLRQRLGFTGLTITDAIGAGALASYGSISNRALQAAVAGMQIILSAGQNVTEGVNAASGLSGGYRSGKLAHSAFQATVTQILTLRSNLPA